MRYIRAQVPVDLLEELSSSTTQTIQLVVDTEASPVPTVIARVEAASADAIVDALNAV